MTMCPFGISAFVNFAMLQTLFSANKLNKSRGWAEEIEYDISDPFAVANALEGSQLFNGMCALDLIIDDSDAVSKAITKCMDLYNAKNAAVDTLAVEAEPE